MSGVLHPVGPESEETYWLRRAMVAGAALLLVILVVALFVNSTSTGSAVATPATPSPTSPATEPGATPSAVPSGVSPSPSASASASASASPSTSAASTSSAEASSKPAGKASSKPSDKASSTSSDKASSTSSDKASGESSKKATPAGPVTCSPAKLRATLTGDQRLKPEEKTTFTLSLINGSGASCRVSVSPKNFELTIYSGSDRIWSSDDCATAVRPITEKIAAEDAVTWSMAWNGRRSADDCKVRPEVPRPGTYVATAQLKGADPVQFRMILRG